MRTTSGRIEKDEYKLVTRPPASAEAIAKLEESIGLRFPVEFHGLYQCHDGVGVAAEPDKTYWMFTPISKIPRLITDTRGWFEDTHPEVAKRFFPFIDWSSGDSVGYLLSRSRERLPALYEFEHEEYEFDASQDEAEFLRETYATIEELLTPE